MNILQIQLDVEVCHKEMAIELLLNSCKHTYVNIYIKIIDMSCVLLHMQNQWKMYADTVALQMKIANWCIYIHSYTV